MHQHSGRRSAVATDSRRVLLVCLLVTIGLAHVLVGIAQAQPLRISEVLSAPLSDWDGDGEVDIVNDEWVEIVNVTNETLSLAHLYLRDATGDTYHYGFTGSLLPGQARLVTGTMAKIWQAGNNAGSSGLSLNNTGDRVELWSDDPAGTPVFVDVMQVPPHTAGPDRSVALDLATNSYVLHDGLSPYTGSLLPAGNGCPPSPGVAGTCDSEVGVTAESFGVIKSNFHD